MKKLITLLLIITSINLKAQDNLVNTYTNFKDCGIGGSVNLHDDSMKNRYNISKSYIDLTFKTLKTSKITQPIPNNGFVSVSGYVILVKDGGPETCNCQNKDDKTTWDTHIELVEDSTKTDNKDAVICEINGRVREIMRLNGIDWTTKTLNKQMVGHYVTIGGQLFFDDHHKQNSVVDNPSGTTLWRATTLEIHPVTYIKILR